MPPVTPIASALTVEQRADSTRHNRNRCDGRHPLVLFPANMQSERLRGG
jgi:hypothetical protein